MQIRPEPADVGTTSFVQRLQQRLSEAEGTLDAIRSGQVDALVITGPEGDQVYTLKGAEQPYRIMIEQMNEGAVTLTQDGRIIYCNRRFSDMVDRPIHKLMGRSFFELQGRESAQNVAAFLAQAVHGRRHLESHLVSSQGTEIPVLFSASPFELEDHLNLCVTVTNLAPLLDAQRESERLKEFNSKLEEMVAARTELLERQATRLRLLALQLTDAEHRERKRLAELIHDHLQQLLVAAKMRVSGLANGAGAAVAEEVKQLLQQAMDSARSLTTELRPPVLYEDGLVAALQWLAQHTKKQYNMDVATNLDPATEPAEEDVKAFLFQAVRELVFNAVKHAGSEDIRIISVVGDSCICISVEDDGVGFDLTALKQKQASNESLGLFSIGERIAALGGTMRVESAPGNGTSICLETPLTVPTAERRVQPQRGYRLRPGVATAAGAHITVMLVDDHQLVRDGISNLLEEDARIRVVGAAENGQEAVAMAAELRPDVIVMDANMPIMNGIEATRHIKRACPEIRIVGLSVHKDAAIAESFQQAGAVAFLSKDGDVSCLLETIHACCQGKGSECGASR
jgi:PAS domain S-box-containing protein